MYFTQTKSLYIFRIERSRRFYETVLTTATMYYVSTTLLQLLQLLFCNVVCVRFNSKPIVNFPFGSRFSLIVDVQNIRRENRNCLAAWITAHTFFLSYSIEDSTVYATPFSFSLFFFSASPYETTDCANVVCTLYIVYQIEKYISKSEIIIIKVFCVLTKETIR